MTTSLSRSCYRCPTQQRPVTTHVPAVALDGVKIRQQVDLCHPCRVQANKENAEAEARSLGRDVTK